MKRQLSLLIATVFYIGFFPVAPGTCASAVTTLAFYLVWRTAHGIVPALHLSVACLVAAIGVFAAAAVSRDRNDEDPGIVVVDEVAGQLVALLFLPLGVFNLIAATFLFRVFDIWKPFPIRRLESLPNGVGIVADDLLAGVYANLILQLTNWLTRR